MCVSYGPLCCRHCQPPPPSPLALGLGGLSLSRERSHLMESRLILGLASGRCTRKALCFLKSLVGSCQVYLQIYQILQHFLSKERKCWSIRLKLSDLNFLNSPLTCEHAFIDDAGAADQHSVTWHDGPVAGDDHHITGHQISRQNFFDICQEEGSDGGVEKVNTHR